MLFIFLSVLLDVCLLIRKVNPLSVLSIFINTTLIDVVPVAATQLEYKVIPSIPEILKVFET